MIPANSLLFAPVDYRLSNHNSNVNVVPATTFVLTPYERLNHAQFSQQAYEKQPLERLHVSLGHTYEAYIKISCENRHLRQEIAELHHLLRNKENGARDVSLPLPIVNISQNHSRASPNPSLTPNDSISQAGASSPDPVDTSAPKPTLVSQPNVRPSEYPFSILWDLKDCQSDPSLSRATMEKCIRNSDGTRISRQQWSSIMDATLKVVNEELRPLQPAVGLGTRTHYHKFFFVEWRGAIARLEAEIPVLGLCAAHWKAELTLAQILDNRRAGEARAARHRKRALTRAITSLGI